MVTGMSNRTRWLQDLKMIARTVVIKLLPKRDGEGMIIFCRKFLALRHFALIPNCSVQTCYTLDALVHTAVQVASVRVEIIARKCRPNKSLATLRSRRGLGESTVVFSRVVNGSATTREDTRCF